MTSAFSWQNSISLCPASFRTPRPNLPVTPGIVVGQWWCDLSGATLPYVLWAPHSALPQTIV